MQTLPVYSRSVGIAELRAIYCDPYSDDTERRAAKSAAEARGVSRHEIARWRTDRLFRIARGDDDGPER